MILVASGIECIVDAHHTCCIINLEVCDGTHSARCEYVGEHNRAMRMCSSRKRRGEAWRSSPEESSSSTCSRSFKVNKQANELRPRMLQETKSCEHPIRIDSKAGTYSLAPYRPSSSPLLKLRITVLVGWWSTKYCASCNRVTTAMELSVAPDGIYE